jgi:hypothetical protein
VVAMHLGTVGTGIGGSIIKPVQIRPMHLGNPDTTPRHRSRPDAPSNMRRVRVLAGAELDNCRLQYMAVDMGAV